METATPAQSAPTARRHAHARTRGGPRPGVVIPWVLVGLGSALRIRQYVFDRSLWNDEASLAINILGRSYAGLTRPLGVVQGAPVGFLWLEKTATELLGPGEDALRLVPLLAGIVALVLFRGLVTRVLPPLGACVALALFAVAPSLVYYASESKQYGVDVAAAVALAWYLPWLLERPLTRRRCLAFGVTAAVLVWCSFPAAFVAGAVALVVVVALVRRGEWRVLPAFVAACALWGASFLVEYVVSLRDLHSNRALLGYWAFAFAPRPLAVHSTLAWLARDVPSVAHVPFDLGALPLAAGLLVVGVVGLVWRRRAVGAFVLVLAGVVVVAGIAHAYPMADRMVLFALPFTFLVLAASLLVSRRTAVQLALVALIVVVSVPALGSAASAVVHPYTRTEVRGAYAFVEAHRQPGDGVLVEGEGIPAFLYYHRTLGVDADGVFRMMGSPTPCDNAAQLDQLRRWRRVWLVFATAPDSEAGHPIAEYLRAFGWVGRPTAAFYAPGPSGAVLLEVSPTPATAAPTVPAPSWQPDPYGCLTVDLGNLADAESVVGDGS